MFGFLIGALCLGGFIALARGRHGYRHHGYAHGCHRGGPFHRGRSFLYAAFERLDTTPGQEKAITAALDDFRDSARTIKNRVKDSRGELAEALRQDQFEPERVERAVARHSEELNQLASVGAKTLGRIHEALDPEQRKRVARWLESGPGHFFA